MGNQVNGLMRSGAGQQNSDLEATRKCISRGHRPWNRTGGMNSMIREAQSGDLQAIESFDVFGGNRSLDLKDGRLFVSVCDGLVSGFGVLSQHGLLGRPYLDYLVTHPSHRRQGVASRIVEYVELLHAGERFFVSTEHNNVPMLALLKKRGYLQAGTISGANHDGSDEVYFYKDVRPKT